MSLMRPRALRGPSQMRSITAASAAVRQLLDGAIDEFCGAIVVVGKQTIFYLRLNLLQQFAPPLLILPADRGVEQAFDLGMRRIELAYLAQNFDCRSEAPRRYLLSSAV